MCGLLGLELNVSNDSNDFDTVKVEALIKERDNAKVAKNWALADEIRDKLNSMGIVIKDTREGTKWHMV
jgi:cysteinyl-tRNA synthetase